MNAFGKTIDKTFLSVDTAEKRGFLHRDYIAHCFRWSHVLKVLAQNQQYKEAWIVDVGCGREAPLAKTLYSSRFIPGLYTGIDYGPIPKETRDVFSSGKFPTAFYEYCDFTKSSILKVGKGSVDFVVCFEVLEHVEPKHMLEMLRGIQTILSSSGKAFISTPCWDVKSCAANHVNEMRYETFGAVLEAIGFTIRDVHGTFASISEYQQYLAPAHKETFEDLRSYYDTNLLATMLAPFYPQYSRNCLWTVTKSRSSTEPKKFEPITNVPTPWGSSANWKDLQVQP